MYSIYTHLVDNGYPKAAFHLCWIALGTLCDLQDCDFHATVIDFRVLALPDPQLPSRILEVTEAAHPMVPWPYPPPSKTMNYPHSLECNGV